MEQKKLLLVLVSVGVFLVIVLGAGILVFKPRPKPTTSGPVAIAPAASTQAPASADPAEWVRNPKAMPGLQAPASAGASNRGDVIIIYGERPNGGAPVPNATVSTDGSLKVDVAVPQAQELSPIAPQPIANEAAKPIASASAKKAPLPAAKPEKDRTVRTTASVKKPATGATTKAANRGEEFWIQTGSFAAKARAETAKETLGVKGIASLVETKEISGKTYFRVRVGPYSSKNEADYWLSLVKTIDGFAGSYVSQMKLKR